MNEKVSDEVYQFTGYRGSAVSAVTIRCQNYTTWKQQIVVVAEEDRVNCSGTTRRNGQASHYHRC